MAVRVGWESCGSRRQESTASVNPAKKQPTTVVALSAGAVGVRNANTGQSSPPAPVVLNHGEPGAKMSQ
jgi:hypothetical protein